MEPQLVFINDKETKVHAKLASNFATEINAVGTYIGFFLGRLMDKHL